MSLLIKTSLALACLLLVTTVEAQMPPMMPAMPTDMMPTEPASEVSEGVGLAAVTNGVEVVKDGTRPRDPFWPVGYTPVKVVKRAAGSKESGTGSAATVVESAPEAVVRAPVWDEARKRLDIRGISLIHEKDSNTPKYLVMITGKLVEVGEAVTVKFDGRVYRWRVVGISEDGVSLQKIDVRGD